MALDAPHSLSLSGEHVAGQTDIETIVYTYYDDVYRLARSILDDDDAADDATQQTFIAAAASLNDFRGESQIKTWLFAIAVNECRQQLRRRQRRQRLWNALNKIQSLFEPSDTPEEVAAHNERNRRLRAAVGSLPKKQRLPIILRYVHNLTAPEIAAVLGIGEGTVYSRLHYARKRLRHLLGE